MPYRDRRIGIARIVGVQDRRDLPLVEALCNRRDLGGIEPEARTLREEPARPDLLTDALPGHRSTQS
jgi:hypothetical protein